MHPTRPVNTTQLLGIQLTLCNNAELLELIGRWIQDNQKAIVLSGNVQSFNLAYSTPWLRAFMNQADVVRLDGAGLRLGAKILGIATPPRMTWADFAWDMAELCATQGYTLFFLGGRPGIAEKAADKLRERFPTLPVVGSHHGYFDKSPGSAENEAVIDAIQKAQPDILLIGFGMPVQEKWLMENRPRLNVPVVLTGGAVFDYVSGELRRPPRWMTDHGLEWLGRLLIEPGRLWRRYVVGNPLFLWRVLKQRLGFS